MNAPRTAPAAPPISALVVGVGHLGQHHARILADFPDVNLVGVVDLDLDRARQVAHRHGTRAYGEHDSLVGRVDGVVVAATTRAHAAIATDFLRGGAHVFVEKPLAANMAEAEFLVRCAEEMGRVLQVGHIERFNPAVEALLAHLEVPLYVETERLGVFSGRSMDVDVVMDLMIHDLDLVMTLVGAPLEEVDAVGVPVLTGSVDIATARLRFASGCVATLKVSRVSARRTRRLRIFQPESYLSVDLDAQTVEVRRVRSAPGPGEPVIDSRCVEVSAGEPLARELRSFVDAVQGKGPPAVTGRMGYDAMEAAQRVRDAIARSVEQIRRTSERWHSRRDTS